MKCYVFDPLRAALMAALIFITATTGATLWLAI